jgi:general secretion pathway protein D
VKFFLFLLIPILLCAESISEKKAALAQKNIVRDTDVTLLNDRLSAVKRSLEEAYAKAGVLAKEEANEGDYLAILSEVNRLRKEKLQLEESWRETAVQEGIQDGEAYSLWDQEEITLSQLILEYGSPDYLYVIPPEFAAMKLYIYSNIPIPRQSWTDLLGVMLQHNGLGMKKLNTYARQIYLLKLDLGAVQTVAYRPEHVTAAPEGSRICYLVLPPIEQVKSVFQFFEKFSDNKQTFVHQIGGKIALVATKEEIERLLDFYDKVWGSSGGKVTRVVPVSKIQIKEMEKILMTFFNEALDKGRAPFGKPEPEGLGIFALGHSNSLVLIGAKESVDRAEKIVKETEEQLENPSEMTIYLYTCRHSDPNDLAQVLERVYSSLIFASQEGAPRETELNFNSAIQGAKAPPDGYPPAQPLVITPPPLHPGISTKIDVEQNVPGHFIPDPKTGTVLMTVRKDALGRIKELLKKLDIPKKMVQLEVLLFERRVNSQDNFGLNLLRLGKPDNGITYRSLEGGRETGRAIEKAGDAAARIKHGRHEKESLGKGVLQFFFHGPHHKYTPSFDIAYNFLLTQADIQLNAAPSIITVNQTPAMISIMEELSINNGAAPIDTNKGIAFQESYTRAQYGIDIILTPTIHMPDEAGDEKGAVTLKANISFDTPQHDPHNDRPHVDRRHIENEVRVIDGETVILGGLRRKWREDREEKVPFFGDIPFFGRFFGTTRLSDHDTELFFFITPKIVYDPKEEMCKIRTEQLKKRPGDIPEFLAKVDEAREKETKKFFKHSLKTFFTHVR